MERGRLNLNFDKTAGSSFAIPLPSEKSTNTNLIDDETDLEESSKIWRS